MNMRCRHHIAPILAALAVGLFSTACGLHISLDAQAQNDWTREYTLAAGGTLEIRNTSGTIDVETTDGDAVTIQATRRVNAATDEAADEALAAFEIRETVSDEHILIDSTNEDRGVTFNLRRQVDYTIRLPRSANLTIRATNGEIDARNLEGRFDVRSTNGRITARGLRGDASVETTNGAVRLAMDRLGSGGVTCETTNGAISVELPTDAGADLSARVTNGVIRHEGLDLKVIEESRRRLDGTIGDGGPEVRLQTTNGLIRVEGR